MLTIGQVLKLSSAGLRIINSDILFHVIRGSWQAFLRTPIRTYKYTQDLVPGSLDLTCSIFAIHKNFISLTCSNLFYPIKRFSIEFMQAWSSFGQ